MMILRKGNTISSGSACVECDLITITDRTQTQSDNDDDDGHKTKRK